MAACNNEEQPIGRKKLLQYVAETRLRLESQRLMNANKLKSIVMPQIAESILRLSGIVKFYLISVLIAMG